MRVLVTGVAGFIGAAVAEALLARGDAVIGVDDLNPYYDPALKRARLARLAGDFAFHAVDFSDAAALDRALAGRAIDRIVHLGAQAGVGHSLVDPLSYARSNLVGHLVLLELARARRVGHFVYASSSSVYGGSTALPFGLADRADRPVSLYAATKRADELMTEAYVHLFGFPATGLRFFTVYGPWGRPDMAMWKFTDAVLRGLPINLFNHGDMRRDFTDIDDIVAGVLAALDRPPAGHVVYNLGNSTPEPLDRVVALIEAATGREARRELLPMQPGDVPATWADIAATTTALGWRPTTALDAGIPRFVDWFRD
ncbi:MAG: NAD-dependent epimerase/dehydratase family protein, partial [Sphingomonadaceae bacterium]|nr:NAD-dependent epimerase/dehydratase family protein [Sphingomonadaceae bacterium]